MSAPKTIFAQPALLELLVAPKAPENQSLQTLLHGHLARRQDMLQALEGNLGLVAKKDKARGRLFRRWLNTSDAVSLINARELLKSLFTSSDLIAEFKGLTQEKIDLLNKVCRCMLGRPFFEENTGASQVDHVYCTGRLRELDNAAAFLAGEDLAFRAAKRLLVYRPVMDQEESVTLPLLAMALCLGEGIAGFTSSPKPLMAVTGESGSEESMALQVKDALAAGLKNLAVLSTGRDASNVLGPRLDRILLPSQPGAYWGSMGEWLEPDGLVSVWRMQTELVWGWLSQLMGGAQRWVLCNVVLELVARLKTATKHPALLQLLPVKASPPSGQSLPDDILKSRCIELEFAPEDSAGRGNGPVRVLADAHGLALVPVSRREIPENWFNASEPKNGELGALEQLDRALKAIPLLRLKNGRYMPGFTRAFDSRDGYPLSTGEKGTACYWVESEENTSSRAPVLATIEAKRLQADAFSVAYTLARSKFLEKRNKGEKTVPSLPSGDELPSELAANKAVVTLYRAMFIADWGTKPDHVSVRKKVLGVGRVMGSPPITFDDGLFLLLSFATVGQEQRAAGSFRQLADTWTADAKLEVPLAALYALSPLNRSESAALMVRWLANQSDPILPIRGSQLYALSSALESLPTLPKQGTDTVEPVTTWASNQRKGTLKPVVDDMLRQRKLQTLGSLIYALGGESSGGVPQVLARFAKAWRNLEGFDDDSKGKDQKLQMSVSPAPTPSTVNREWLLQDLKKAGFTSLRHLAMSSPRELTSLVMNRNPEASRPVVFQLSQGLHGAAMRSVHTERRARRSSKGIDAAQPGLDKSSGRSGAGVPTEIVAPDWNTLFGSLDLCECDEDSSVYGAPAYLVDALEFLRFRTLEKATALSKHCGPPSPQNALEVLLQRRPDLEHLDLSSDNTNRQLPYIDLVNEILEAAVAGDRCTLGDLVNIVYSESPHTGSAWPAEGVAVPDDLREKLRSQDINVTREARFTWVDLPAAELAAHPCRQVLFLRDRGVALRFQRDESCGLWKITRLKNSTRSEAALAAEPEYVNAKAYENLAKKSSGFSLPLSLGEALINSYLSMVPAKLLDIDQMWCDTPQLVDHTEDQAAADTTVRDEDRLRRVARSMGIQWLLAQRIVAAPDSDDKDFWFWANGKHTGQLNVREFLRGTRKSGERPRFSPFSALCRTSFVGARSELGLRGQNLAAEKNCDTALRMVHWNGGNLAETALQPVSRLLRLFHALQPRGGAVEGSAGAAWSIEEIDQAIASPGIGNGTLGIAVLEGIRDIAALQARYRKVRRAEWLSMFGLVHHSGYRHREDSLYWQRFLDPVRTQQGETSEAYEFFLPEKISKGLAQLKSRRQDLALRLGVTEPEFEELVARVCPAGMDTRISHSLLSKLLAHCTVRRALGVAWGDWFVWRRLFMSSRPDVDVVATPSILLSFLDFINDHKAHCGLKPVQLERLLTGQGAEGERSDPDSLLPKDKEVLAAVKSMATDCSGQLKEAFQVWTDRHRAANGKEASQAWWQAWTQANPASYGPNPAPLATQVWSEVLAMADFMSSAREQALLNPESDTRGDRFLPQSEELRSEGPWFKDFQRALGELASNRTDTTFSTPDSAWKNVEPLWIRILTWAGFGASIKDRMNGVRQAIATLAKARADLETHSGRLTDADKAAFDASRQAQVQAEQQIFYLLQAPLVAARLLTARTATVSNTLAALCKRDPRLLTHMLLTLQLGDGSAFDQLIVKTDWAEIQRMLKSSDLAAINDSDVFVPADEGFGAIWLTVLSLARAAELMRAIKLDDQAWVWVMGTDGHTLNMLSPLALPVWRWEKHQASDGKTSVSTPLQPRNASGVVSRWLQLLNLAQMEVELPSVAPSALSEDTVSVWKLLRAALLLRAEMESKKPPTPEQAERAVMGLCVGLDMLLSAPSDSAWSVLRVNWNLTAVDAPKPQEPLGAQKVLQRLLCLPNYRRARQVLDWEQQTGLSLPLMQTLCRDPENEAKLLELAAQVRTALKRRFEDVDWFSNLRASMNLVREAKRDALVNYLLSQKLASGGNRFASVNGLYKHYLIDVDKAPIELTSRVVQAHATVQLFASRCLMGSEPMVRIESNALPSWAPWTWMKEYRVWQAARKIFLYPENWLYPELRDDRSVFFKELQAALSQNKLDARTVQDAVLAYLQKLQEVARLEIVSSFTEVESGRLTVYVVGRTRTEPRSYFYRRWIEQREWTPWERIEVEINGDHVLVFARNGRVHLAWLLAESKPKADQNYKIQKANEKNEVEVEVKAPKHVFVTRLALSQYVNGTWTAKRVSPSSLEFDGDEEDPSKEKIKRIQLVYEQTVDAMISVYVRQPETAKWSLQGSFVLSTCSGFAEARSASGDAVTIYPSVQRSTMVAGRFLETQLATPAPDDSLILLEGPSSTKAVNALSETPGQFMLMIPRQASLLDLTAGVISVAASGGASPGSSRTVGAWLPSFYHDNASSDILIEQADPDGKPRIGPLQQLLGQLNEWALIPTNKKNLESAFSALVDRIDGSRFNDDELFQALDESLAETNGRIGRLAELIPETLGDDQATVELYQGRMHHPEACNLLRAASGHPERWWLSLYSRELQQTLFNANRGRTEKTTVAFDYRDGYAGYNWEVFVHIPMLLAQRHADAGDFEGSFRWFQQIFNPQATSQRVDPQGGASNYWIAKPFAQHNQSDYEAQRIDLLIDPDQWKRALKKTAEGKPTDEANAWLTALNGLRVSVEEWRLDPANPYKIARYRWVAQQKSVVFQLIKMLIDWGDSKFRLFEREALTQATQLYMLASELLGERPIVDVPNERTAVFSYEEIRFDLDRDNESFMRILAQSSDVENHSAMDADKRSMEEKNATLSIYNDHFCVPQNEELSRLWDKVEDRLYKLRHSQDIDGVERVLALFAPPIDPGALVRARGAGLSMSEVLAGLHQPLPHHRFNVTWGLAMDLAREVRALGNELQAALEKKDGEELALLRNRQEEEIHNKTKIKRKSQIQEARLQVDALQAMRNAVLERQVEYAGREEISEMEQLDFTLRKTALGLRYAAQGALLFGSVAAGTPESASGYAAVGPLLSLTYGGSNISAVARGAAAAFEVLSEISNVEAGVVATRAGYRRRKEDWNFQAKQANAELKQIDKQIKAAELRVAMADTDLEVLERQIEHVKQQAKYLKSDKFTNAELYDWLARQATALYYRYYQLALEFARKAERCLDFEWPPRELGNQGAIVGSAYWDGSRRGLTAANGLIEALSQLKAEQQRRDVPEAVFPVIFSLREQDPMALLHLRTAGRCKFRLSKAFFDRLFPGHVQWRIADHAWALDCIAGPTTPIAVRLTLLSSKIHFDLAEDGRTSIDPTPVRSDYTCTGRSDSSRMRYAPDSGRYGLFEFAGAVSDWEVEIPGDCLFDWSTISDFTLTLNVMSRRQGSSASTPIQPGPRLMVSLRENFAAEFSQLIRGKDVPVVIGPVLNNGFSIYSPLDVENDPTATPKVCAIVKPGSAGGAASFMVAKSDGTLLSTKSSLVLVPSHRSSQTAQLLERQLSSDEARELISGGRVRLEAGKREVVDVILLMPPRKAAANN